MHNVMTLGVNNVMTLSVHTVMTLSVQKVVTHNTNYADTPYQLHQNGTGSDSAMTASCGTSLDLLTVFREKVSLRRHAVEFKFNV